MMPLPSCCQGKQMYLVPVLPGVSKMELFKKQHILFKNERLEKNTLWKKDADVVNAKY